MPTASNAVRLTPPVERAELPFIFASRYAGRNGLQSCSPRPKNRTESRTMPTVRFSARRVRSEGGPVIIPSSGGARPRRSRTFDRRGQKFLPRLDDLHAVILQRERADSLAGCREVRVEHGRGRHADRRFADATPETS